MAALLVRHAAAGDRRQFDGDDRDRPLSDLGYEQALALVSLLAPHRPDRVISSPAVRCIETVTPLAQELGLDVEVAEALFEGETRRALEVLRGCKGAPIVLCSHGDVIPYVLDALQREESLRFASEARWKKASTWVLDRDEEGWTASYLPPPSLR